MASDESGTLFTDNDPSYRGTRLESGIPPPSLATLPRAIRNVRGGNTIAQPAHTQPILHQQQPQQPRNKQATIDVVGRNFVVIHNNYPPNITEQLSTPDWARMMSERDDMRGRRGDSRLGEISIMQSLHQCKESILNSLSGATTSMESLALETNVYSGLGNSCFVDSSAVKLAHLDFLLQTVREYIDSPNAGDLRFVDIGSSNGGFTEYILWRAKKQGRRNASGWYFARPQGMGDSGQTSSSYSINLDKLMPDCEAAQATTVFTCAGDRPDSVLDPANVESFIRLVKERTDSSTGIDLVVADGSPDLPDLNIDPERPQFAYIIAQAIVALRLLHKGGTFVFKVFDTFSPLSAELLFVLHTCFERMAVVKSLASRPTSAERYIVCNHLKDADFGRLSAHLFAALAKVYSDNLKLSHVVSWTRVSSDKRFVGQLFDANMRHSRAQLHALNSVLAAAGDDSKTNGLAGNQREVANLCFKNWHLPAA